MDQKNMQRPCQAVPMTGGRGVTSYASNSSFQREVWELVKTMIEEAIQEMDQFSSSTTLKIADLGCSVGPNTFFSMKSIVDTFVQKYARHGASSCNHDFQVFFSDHSSNDFNTLFTSIPPNQSYFVAGVPGSFHGRLFPKKSLHFVNSSYALHWLSEVPKEVMNVNSPAWNRGRIFYIGASEEVREAYSKQFERDFEVFLGARAEEMVGGGLMALLLNGRDEEIESVYYPLDLTFSLLGSSLVDMASEGVIEEFQVDSFNLPIFNPSAEELKKIVKNNGFFSIERANILRQSSNHTGVIEAKTIAMHIRAGFEDMLSKHFGSKIIDELFWRHENKIREKSHMFKSTNFIDPSLFVLLKRKDDHGAV